MKDQRTLFLPFDAARPEPHLSRTPTEKPTSPPLEHFLSTQAVREHLTKRGLDVARYCKFEWMCDVWRVEELLLEDLSTAKSRGDVIETNKVRALIRAVSWISHDRPDGEKLKKELRVFVHRKLDELATRERYLRSSEARDVADEIAEDAARLDRDGRMVLAALEHPRLGDTAEPSLQIVEHWVDEGWMTVKAVMKKYRLTWDRLEELIQDVLRGTTKLKLTDQPAYFGVMLNMTKEDADHLATAIMTLQSLRPIRDKLLHQKLLPHWYAKEHQK